MTRLVEVLKAIVTAIVDAILARRRKPRDVNYLEQPDELEQDLQRSADEAAKGGTDNGSDSTRRRLLDSVQRGRRTR